MFLIKLNILLSYDPAIPLPGKGNENLCSHKCLYMFGCSSFIHNHKKLEAIKMSMNCGKDKQNMVFHTKEKYSTLKVINYRYTQRDESQKHYAM